MYLERIDGPADVKSLSADALPALCEEIRSAILASSAAVGGHVGSNLAVVELTVALHRVFDSPADQIIFDVSHQCYAHKMLTGRAHGFTDPARYEEVSGFTNPAESPHDHFAVGHTSTAASLACGLAKARDLAGKKHDVVAVIGDGSLSGGLAFEGLDCAADAGSGVIFVVNDNEWSIAPNAGGIYRNLAELRETRGAWPRNIFTAMGLGYRYLEEGNDVHALVAALEKLRGTDVPVVLHVHTRKGKGYAPAEADPEAWHHVKPFDLGADDPLAARDDAADAASDYAQITGEHLLARMKKDRRVVAVSAATPYIMGFGPASRAEAGEQFVDVGIAEEHAVTYCAALAQAGARPVLGVYGTFLQRGFDELIHDVALNGAACTILVFGCSARGANDATHLGIFDIPMLSCVPGLTYLAPTCAEEYLSMLDWSLDEGRGPVAIRVPAAGVVSRPGFAPASNYALPQMELDLTGMGAVDKNAPAAAILALGDLYPMGEAAARALAARGVRVALANPRQATLVDPDSLFELADAGCRLFVTLEDGVLESGFGEKVARSLAARDDVRVRCLGLPRAFPDRFDADGLLAACGLTPEAVADLVCRELGL